MPKTLLAVVVGVALLGIGQDALAIPQFQKAFLEMYINDHEDEDFQKLVKREAKCLVCHQGKKKTNHNVYGDYFVERLTKDDKDDTDKIMKTLEEVGEIQIDPEDEESPTYAEIIASGKLPGGELEDLEKEPEEDDEENGDDEEDDNDGDDDDE